MAQTYSVLILHHMERQSLGSVRLYLDKLKSHLSLIARNPRLSKLMVNPLQYYALYANDDSSYYHYRNYALEHQLIQHP